MPAFSQISAFRLMTAHPDLQVLFNEMIKFYDCSILVGYRNEADQNAAVAAGKSKLAYPNSMHNKKPSYAIDATPYPVDFNDIKRSCYFGGLVMGVAQRLLVEGKISHAIRWGGDWSGSGLPEDSGLIDMDHFEILDNAAK